LLKHERLISMISSLLMLLSPMELVLSFQLSLPRNIVKISHSWSSLASSSSSSSDNFYNDFEGYGADGDDGDAIDDAIDSSNSNSASNSNSNKQDDEYIDSENLGDWRTFRMNLAETGVPTDKKQKDIPRKSVSKENEAVLRSQSKLLFDEYETGVWSHQISLPEIGALTLRMPLEVEIYRNSKQNNSIRNTNNNKFTMEINDNDKVRVWYRKAHKMAEQELNDIGTKAENGQIDATKLSDRARQFLEIYLDNQETWQEVCLVLEQNPNDGTATSLVLNRPMAFKVSQNLASLILHGSVVTNKQYVSTDIPQLEKFMEAFGQECAVYIGGPDDQDKPAILIHGFPELDGAKELAPGTNIYRGGLNAAVEGVLNGNYKPLDFRFFVGRHGYDQNKLELDAMIGKIQPVACARALALKQCISLPKPLWHEVMELCGGEFKKISSLELQKMSDLGGWQVEADDDDDDDDDIDDDDIDNDEIVDELDQLDIDEDDEDDVSI